MMLTSIFKYPQEIAISSFSWNLHILHKKIAYSDNK